MVVMLLKSVTTCSPTLQVAILNEVVWVIVFILEPEKKLSSEPFLTVTKLCFIVLCRFVNVLSLSFLKANLGLSGIQLPNIFV